jgi:type I restriction-modification system DNA methylase subunit
MKVIEPLFLDELQAALEDARGNLKKLNALRTRLANIKIFDPACGSGNFLIIAYKELRKLEMAIFKEIDHINKTYSAQFSDIRLSNFYGIELDDFAHELAILALWLAEHQMNQVFFKEFGRSKPPLPLLATGNIIQGNACRINWESVCPKLEDDEIYILGNPPYIGSRRQDDSQKNDLKLLFEKDYKSLDYIAAWFLKGANYIREINAKCAFVSTNSICQGEQVNLLWSRTLINNIEIGFAYSNFKWTNNAKGNAGVTVIIICLQNRNNREKYLYSKDNLRKTVKIINPYLTEANIVYIQTRQKTLSNFPEMNFGNMPADGGKLLFTTEEKREFVEKEPDAESYFRKLISAEEFLNGKERWCLWLDGYEDNEFVDFPLINQRIEDLKKIRAASSRPQLASIPHLFAQITQPKGRGFILIPRHSSENRDYIPISWFDEDNVAHDSCLIIPTDNFYLFSIFTSKMHMIWVNAVCGRLETRYRYSKDIVYNNFPFPPITTEQKATLENHVYNIIDERDRYSERTLAELYDPDKMPDGLREAHRMNDIAVEQCYRNRPFESDEERLEYLFKLYEKMIAEEQERGTLFASEKKKNKK